MCTVLVPSSLDLFIHTQTPRSCYANATWIRTWLPWHIQDIQKTLRIYYARRRAHVPLGWNELRLGLSAESAELLPPSTVIWTPRSTNPNPNSTTSAITTTSVLHWRFCLHPSPYRYRLSSALHSHTQNHVRLSHQPSFLSSAHHPSSLPLPTYRDIRRKEDKYSVSEFQSLASQRFRSRASIPCGQLVS